MSRYTLLGSPYVRIAALPVDKFPKKGSSALSVFADTVISEPGIRAVLENSAPSFYAAVTKNLAEDSVVPEKLRTLDRGRPWRDSQFASTRLSPSRDMSR